MGNFCIMRCSKLHTDGNVGGSVSHALRTRETLNADESRTAKNWCNWQHQDNGRWVVDSPEEANKKAMARYRSLLKNVKLRKNGVQAIELLMTVSPEVMQRSDFKITDYLNACDKWAKKTFGEKNVFLITHHRDEKTPHTSILLVPKVEKTYKDGHKEFVLNAKKYLGGREKLRALQTDFYNEVGKKFGLERGIEGSKAHHQEIQKYYAKVNNQNVNLDKAAVDILNSIPKKKMFQKDEEWQADVLKAIQNGIDSLKPQFAPLLNLWEDKKDFEKTKESWNKEVSRINAENLKKRNELDTRKNDLDKRERDLDARKNNFDDEVKSEVKKGLNEQIPLLRDEFTKAYEDEYVPQNMRFTKGDRTVDFKKTTYRELAKELADFYLNDSQKVHERKREIEREFERNRSRTL